MITPPTRKFRVMSEPLIMLILLIIPFLAFSDLLWNYEPKAQKQYQHEPNCRDKSDCKICSECTQTLGCYGRSHVCNEGLAINKQIKKLFASNAISVWACLCFPNILWLLHLQLLCKKICSIQIKVNEKPRLSCLSVLNNYIHITPYHLKLTEAIYSEWTLGIRDKQVLWVTKLHVGKTRRSPKACITQEAWLANRVLFDSRLK